MSDFHKALALTLRFEGGYAKVPGDHGGATMKGITQSTYDLWRVRQSAPKRSVQLITDYEVTQIYYEEYWLKAHCEYIPDPLARVHFDSAVNSGVGRAAQWLQEALGVTVDGQIGPKTLAAAKASDPVEAANTYLGIREAFLRSIGHGSQAKFLKGWLARVETLRESIA